MPGRFKDYIAIPRVNGYQSLHTTLFGPNGVPVEVQIRTEDMHRVADAGIAAHWKYKAKEAANDGAGAGAAREWVTSLVEIQESGGTEEFLENVKVDLFPDKVYVFTPKGKILRLPSGGTVVDFAYAVHTDVGNRCVAAKIDRKLAPLRTVLRSGQTVEIISAKGAMPNPAWVNFVVTVKARTAIRQYLKGLRRSEAIELGSRLLVQALAEFKVRAQRGERGGVRLHPGRAWNEGSRRAVRENWPRCERLAPLVARRLLPSAAETSESGVQPPPLTVAGTEGLLVSYARCCFPVPDDPIMAYLSSGRGIVIHRETCVNVEDYRKHPEKWLAVAWELTTDRTFSSEIRADVSNKTGVLAQVAAAIAASETNIAHVLVDERDAETSTLVFELKVRDRLQLAGIMRG